MQHLEGISVVALLSPTLEKVLQMWHLELPEMKADVVVVALLTVPLKSDASILYPQVTQKQLTSYEDVTS